MVNNLVNLKIILSFCVFGLGYYLIIMLKKMLFYSLLLNHRLKLPPMNI